MTEWRYQFPSTALSRQYDQGSAYADLFRGEGNKLLYELKNLMKFRNLGQLKITRFFTDGTVITAWSIFGQDFIKIDVSRAMGGMAPDAMPSCTITFIDLPDFVQPMKYPGEIRTGEVQDIDYFKTYYTAEVKNCKDCQDIAWEFLLTYATPVEPRHYFNPITNKDEPNNHSVYSLYPSCWAEIISQGSDAGGTYIIWKAYTEGGSTLTFSRTGLGIPLLRAIINKADGTELCRQEKKFDVDCCRKSSELRNVEVWWEGVGMCEPFIIYNGKHICKMPASVSMRELITYSTPFYAAQPLYSIPDIKGGCIPLEWTVTGPITLINPGPMGEATYFRVEDGGCTAPVTIKLKDRCGTEDTIIGTPCCDDAAPLSISYVSLLMSCSQQQSFTALGGCGPYSWSVTAGGGTINEGGTYTAPDTNVNCVDNPTIQVTDCCGNSATVKLAINCYAQAGDAIVFGECLPCSGCWCDNRGCDQGIVSCRDFILWSYDCSGALTSLCETSPCGSGGAPCDGNTSGWHQVDCATYGIGCPDPTYGCWTNQCGCGGMSPCPCSTILDSRSAPMKAAGCCPINPYTGLPYDPV